MRSQPQPGILAGSSQQEAAWRNLGLVRGCLHRGRLPSPRRRRRCDRPGPETRMSLTQMSGMMGTLESNAPWAALGEPP